MENVSIIKNYYDSIYENEDIREVDDVSYYKIKIYCESCIGFFGSFFTGDSSGSNRRKQGARYYGEGCLKYRTILAKNL